MMIRDALPSEPATIRQVHVEAFGSEEGPVVAGLALGLLEDASAKPLSLVADTAGRLVGSVIFTTVAVEGHEHASAWILCPLAVLPKAQGQGVGSALIRDGLERLARCGADLVLVYGDPAYYGRTGFVPDHGLQAPFELSHPSGWLVQALRPGALEHVIGRIRCADVLQAPEHW
ncbi:MAG: N-acetyltransferase [Pseudomonadota bacterium]